MSAAKVDRNQSEIVKRCARSAPACKARRSRGWRADLPLMAPESTIEVKDGSPPSGRKPTPSQWHDAWAGRPVFVVTCVDQVLKILKP